MNVKCLVAVAVALACAGPVMANGSYTYASRADAVQYIADASPTLPVLPTGPAQILPPGAPAFNTNGLDFTNVTVKVALGYEAVGTAGSVSYDQVDADLYAFKSLDIGLGGELALGDMNNGIYSAAADIELIKNLSNFQLVGKLGAGRNFEENVGWYGEVGLDINYNLTQATGWGFLGSSTTGIFTYCGAGVKAQALNFKINSNGSNINKMLTLYVGFAL